MSNEQLLKAKEAKNDEFYTTFQTVEEEINSYDISIFAGKTIYCNTDCFMSAFTIFFRQNFERLKLKKLICTGFDRKYRCSDTVIVDKTGTQFSRLYKNLKGGNYKSERNQSFLEEADIVITNPPFSIWDKFVKNILEKQKDFLLIGNINIVTTKNWLPLFSSGKVKMGYKNTTLSFFTNQGETKKLGNTCWITTLPVKKPFYKPKTKFDLSKYNRYINIDAIHIATVKDIPLGYMAAMGVPLNFIHYINLEQYELLNINPRHTGHPMGKEFLQSLQQQGKTGHYSANMDPACYYDNNNNPHIPYSRIFIKERKNE